MNRGDVWDADVPGGRRPVVVLTRNEAIPLLRRVTVAPITSTIRGLPSEVRVGEAEGLDHDSAVSCDNIVTLPQVRLDRRRGALGPDAVRALDAAVIIALGIDAAAPAV
jgi:mRNA interferase MazF